MLAPGGEFDRKSELTEMALASLSMYPDFVDALFEESGLPIDYQRCGAIEIARTDREAAELEHRAACQSVVGIRSESIPWPSSAAARFYPDDALVSPRDVVAALRAACVRSGAAIHEQERVTEVFADGTGLRTVRGVYRSDGVLIAAGAWSSELALPFSRPAVKPVRGHLIAYAAEPGLMKTILRHESTYLLQRNNGTIVAGSSSEHAGFDRTVDGNVVADIHSRASQLLPELAAMSPVDSWIGFRPFIEGGVPAVGRVDGTNIWTAFGHYRNGILLAPETARRIEESVVC